MIYSIRFLFLVICLIAVIFILLFLIMLAIYFIDLMTRLYTGKDPETGTYPESTVMRTGRIMNIMKSIPYSTFMLREARDCPICLATFTDDCEVV